MKMKNRFNFTNQLFFKMDTVTIRPVKTPRLKPDGISFMAVMITELPHKTASAGKKPPPVSFVVVLLEDIAPKIRKDKLVQQKTYLFKKMDGTLVVQMFGPKIEAPVGSICKFKGAIVSQYMKEGEETAFDEFNNELKVQTRRLMENVQVQHFSPVAGSIGDALKDIDFDCYSIHGDVLVDDGVRVKKNYVIKIVPLATVDINRPRANYFENQPKTASLWGNFVLSQALLVDPGILRFTKTVELVEHTIDALTGLEKTSIPVKVVQYDKNGKMTMHVVYTKLYDLKALQCRRWQMQGLVLVPWLSGYLITTLDKESSLMQAKPDEFDTVIVGSSVMQFDVAETIRGAGFKVSRSLAKRLYEECKASVPLDRHPTANALNISMCVGVSPDRYFDAPDGSYEFYALVSHRLKKAKVDKIRTWGDEDLFMFLKGDPSCEESADPETLDLYVLGAPKDGISRTIQEVEECLRGMTPEDEKRQNDALETLRGL